MSHTHYDVSSLSIDQRKDMIRRAKEKCFSWWVDILDCKKSFARQKIEADFEETLNIFNENSFFNVIHRLGYSEDHLELSFSTMNTDKPEIFLWVNVKPNIMWEFVQGLKAR